MPSSSSTPPSPLSLREVRRNFVQHKLENRPALDMLQYGNVTLIHKKLDSWIDGKPELDEHKYHCSWTEDHKMLKLEHDHLKCRKQRLAKQRSKLQRSWSGNISLIQRDSLIDVVPKTAAAAAADGRSKKRTKPRRISSHDNIVYRQHARAKDMLLDGDIQTVRKVILERKLSNRPLLPYPQDFGADLFRELQKLQQRATAHQPREQRRLPAKSKSLNSKAAPERILYRVQSLSAPVRRPVFLMPQSA